MANFEDELSKLMGQFSPQGGFGIQNLGGFQNMLRRDSAIGEKRAIAGDQFQLNRRGLGRSVAGAFSGGTRRSQFSQQLMDAMTQLQGKHSTMAESQRQSLMGLLAPQATARANRPSFISSLLGGIGGLAGQALIPGLAGGGGSLMAMFSKMFGGGTQGQGFAGQSSPKAFKFELDRGDLG